MIYDLVLPYNETIQVKYEYAGCPITRVCQKMRQECLPLYLGRRNRFYLDHDTDLGFWVRQIGAELISSPSRELHVRCFYHDDGDPCYEYGCQLYPHLLTYSLICLGLRYDAQNDRIITIHNLYYGEHAHAGNIISSLSRGPGSEDLLTVASNLLKSGLIIDHGRRILGFRLDRMRG